MSKGWILLHRQIQDCWLWDERPFSKGQAWIDLLLLANHKDTKISIDGKPVPITRGQFHTSEVKLADRWGWNRKTVIRFLDVLESDRMLSKVCTRRGTTITIVNYENFQDIGTTEGTPERTTEGTPERTQTNNEKNEKNENKYNSAFIPPTFDDVSSYCRERNNNVNPQNFIDFYESKGWMIGKNKMKDWKASVRTWERRGNNVKTPQYKQFAHKDDVSDLEKELLAN